MDETTILCEAERSRPPTEASSGFSSGDPIKFVRKRLRSGGPSVRLTLLGALYFGSLALATCVMFGGSLPMGSLLALPLAGAVGGGGLALHTKGWRAAPGAGLRFAFGFALADLIIFFSLVSLQASVEPLWGATAWGIALALGGGIGGSSLRRPPGLGPRGFGSPTLAGALAFGFSGAVGGWLGFIFFGSWKSPNRAQGLDVGMVLALAMGGALLGAALDRSGENQTPPSPENSG
jgi:hypothetical protein